MDTFLKDLKYALRMLAKKPAFTAIAVLSLTLGIGANTTIFTLVKGVFLESLPVKDPSRLVALFTTDEHNRSAQTQFLPTSVLNLQDYRSKTDVFSGASMAIFTGATLDVNGSPVQLTAALVDWNFFDAPTWRICCSRAPRSGSAKWRSGFRWAPRDSG
jgi:putative ABC transport system permease protein